MKMSKKAFKFNNIEVNKKKFHASKQSIALNSVNLNPILISDKFEHSNKGFKYFIGYKDDNVIRPLCIILPQMSGYIKFFKNGGKNLSFMIENDNVLAKYNKMWNKIKKALNIKFHSIPADNEKYIKAKVKDFIDVVNTNFWAEKYQRRHSSHLNCLCKYWFCYENGRKKDYLEVYLEECKYKIKKKKMPEFLDAELESDSSSDSEWM